MSTVSRAVYGSIARLDSRPWAAAALIFILAFTLRAAILCLLSASTVVWAEEAEHIALSLYRTGHFANPYLPAATGYTAHTGPFFPAFMAVLYGLFGVGTAVYYVRSLLIAAGFAAAYALLPWLGRQLRLPAGSGVVGGIAGALMVTNLSAEIWRAWEEPYLAVGLVALAPFTYKLLRRERYSAWLAALYGAAWGALFYASAALLAMFLATAALFALRRRIKVALTISGAAALVVAPWVLRDHARLGGWMFMRSNPGLELYISNNPAAQATEYANTLHGPFLKLHPNKDLQQALRLRRMGEVRYNQELLQRARSWILSHPARFLMLTGRRAMYFWFPPERVPIHNVLVGLAGIVGLFGFIGMYRANGTAFWVLAPTWLAYPLIYYLIEYSARYRAPITPLVLLCAGAEVAAWIADTVDWTGAACGIRKRAGR